MESIFNRMRQESLRVDHAQAAPKVGIITSYDPTTHRAKVNVMPEALLDGAMSETDWLPIATPLVGAGWGVYAAPGPGEQVLIVHQEHDHGAGIIVGRINSEQQQPLAVPSGEVWMVHEKKTAVKLFNSGELLLERGDGTLVRLAEDGTLLLQNKSGATVTVGNDARIVIHGDTVIEGNLHVTGDVVDVVGSLQSLRQHYNAHLHTGVQNGPGTTAGTTQPDP